VKSFRKALADDDILVFDGAMGTLLQERGMPSGAKPEIFGAENPEVVRLIHEEYVRAGAMLITANSFGASRFKLPADADVRALNRRMAEIARQAAGDNAWVGGGVGPTGKFVKPLGELDFKDMVAAFADQIRGLAEGGVDCIIAETHFDLAEVRAVVIAAREVCDLPVVVNMTFDGKASLTGTGPDVYADAMQNLGVDMIGVNCGQGPDAFVALVSQWLPRLRTPFMVKPNAGLPLLVEGKSVFPMGPDEFAGKTLRLAELGAKAVCGCCGSTPAHIAALAKAVRPLSWKRPEPVQGAPLVLTSRAASVPVGFAHPCAIIGERINPTGKELLSSELQAGEFTEALRFAEEQIAAEASILDVNVGAPMVKEEEVLPGLVQKLVSRFQIPLCLDSNNIDALEEGLWNYPGSALVNSISGEPGRMERLAPICRKHGAPFILLPLKGRKLPVTAAERLAIIEELVDQALSLGIQKSMILVDVLALTVSSKPEAAKACLETIRHCREAWGLPTCLGLSNISFGLPARELVNSTFLSMCMAAGLSAVIANPNSQRLRQTLFASEVLLDRDAQAGRFIARYAGWKPGEGGEGGRMAAATSGAKADNLRDAVILGDKAGLGEMLEKALEEGRKAADILAEDLIPGIMDVGEKYERKDYFLPQLLLSAETMRQGFERLRPLLEEDSSGKKGPKVVMATVEGDIHDIGKNIVCLMLSNHGYEVIDLGKDVPAKTIVETALREKADLIGLSALMTTTMVRMEDTVKLCRELGCAAKIFVGGAVVTREFAESIGAHAHSTDAVDAVKTAARLLG